MPRATRSAKDAVAWGRSQHRSGSSRWGALCLSFVRQAWGLPGVYPHANAAWRAAKKKHTYNGNPKSIPYGAAVFSDRPGGSTYGHVFLAGGVTKDGKKIFWSNDIGGYGKIVPVTIDAFERRWGHRILGWTTDLNGYDLNVAVGAKDKPKGPKPKRIKHKRVPGWWIVDTALLNGRASPSTSARITKKKRRGAPVKTDRAVHHERRLWVRSDRGTWFAASDKGKFKADYIKPRRKKKK